MAHDVFVSYSTADESVAEAVRLQLESTHEISCWMAPSDIPRSAAWDETSIEALDQSKVLVLIQGSGERSSLRVERDVQRAVSQGIKVIPFRVGDAASGDAPDLRINTLAESVKTLLAQRSDNAATRTAAEKSDEPAAGGGCLRLVGIVIGSAFLLSVLVIGGLRLRNEGLTRSGGGAPAQTSPAGEAPPGAADRPAAVDQAPAAETLVSLVPSAAPESPASVQPGGGGTASAAPLAPLAPPEPPPAPIVAPAAAPPAPPAPEPDRAAGEPATIAPGGRTAAGGSVGRPEDGAARSREATGRPTVASSAAGATFGTVVVEFTSNLPDGTIEVEVDGVRRWSERLRVDKAPGRILERLKLQRVSQVFASALTVPAGDHKVTVTVLNADGEVQDFGSTSLRVAASRSVTLRVRFSRFRNRLQLEPTVG